ncbi:histone lysine demethylase PHF8-like [Meriones unguiculatus]|uniref:histone lysine demethylase PHF8-like n=1 Tax=Meriones unguiculatus TaxID=10047 RepID=UPI00293F17DE|nr:histone lysine demethylase PHF8-like [Meriones unguiculatus]
MASVPVYCLCRQPYDMNLFMIECDLCQDWFHGSCVGIEEEKAADIDIYHCPNCAVLHGPSIMKKWRGSSNEHGVLKREPVKTGSPVFIHHLQHKTFESSEEVILKPTGSQLTVEFLEESSFSVPILVLKKDGLGMTLPPTSFTVRDVEQFVGSDKEIDVIDVACQANCKMMLRDFVKYYYSEKREKVFNVVSLEFSNTRLSNMVEMPKIVRKLSWVENLRPEECGFERPKLQKYCLMSVKDSYTDFHIESGGTSVWYHVLTGEKIFYLIHPTDANLTLFECWSNSSNRKEMFFDDQVDKCYKCSVKQGQTLFIPTGWIHAALTPVDCLAFAGNFLHSLNIEMQLKAYETEKQLKTADRFKFPSFEAICWHVGKNIVDIFEGLRENGRYPASYLVRGSKALNVAFQTWTRKEVLPEHENEIPKSVQAIQVIEDLAKEICLVEDIFQQNTQKMSSTSRLQQLFPTSSSSLTRPTRSTSVSKSILALPSKRASKKKASRYRNLSKKAEQKGQQSVALAPAGQHSRDLMQPSNHQVPKLKSSLNTEFNTTSTYLNGSDDYSKPAKVFDGNESVVASLMANGNTKTVKRFSNSWSTRITKKKDISRLVKDQVMGDKFDLDTNDELQIKKRFEPGETEITLKDNSQTDEEMVKGFEGRPRSGSGSGRVLEVVNTSRQAGGPGCVRTEETDSSNSKGALQNIVLLADLHSPPSPAPSGLKEFWSGGQNQGKESSSLGTVSNTPVSQHTTGKWPIKRLAYWRTESKGKNVEDQNRLGARFKDAKYIYLTLESDDDDDDDGDPVLRSLPKKRKTSDNAPWIPRPCVIPTLLKQDCPVHEGTRVASIEKGLAAAAAKLAQRVSNLKFDLSQCSC